MRKLVWMLWLTGLTLKYVGASWDVSFHFKEMRDTLTGAHLVNMIGFLVTLAAFLIEWRSRTPRRQGPLNLVLAGFIVFLAAIPFDEMWHRLYGLDLTTWSPSHMMLFAGTALMVVGILLLFLQDIGWDGSRPVRSLKPTVGQWLVLFFLLVAVVDSVTFPLTYNEYSAVGGANVLSGNTQALGEDIRAFAITLEDPLWGDTPHVLYPAYSLGFGLLIAVLARHVTGVAGTSFLIMAAYVVQRIVGNVILVGTGWAEGAIPWQFLGIGLAVELAWLLRSSAARVLAAAAFATLASYAWWWMGPRLATWVVPLDWTTLPWALVAAIAGFLVADAVAERAHRWVASEWRDPTPLAGRTVAGLLTR